MPEEAIETDGSPVEEHSEGGISEADSLFSRLSGESLPEDSEDKGEYPDEKTADGEAEPEEKLIFGKYKTEEDAHDAYKGLEKKFHEQSQEKASVMKQFEQMRTDFDTLKSVVAKGKSEEPEPEKEKPPATETATIDREAFEDELLNGDVSKAVQMAIAPGLESMVTPVVKDIVEPLIMKALENERVIVPEFNKMLSGTVDKAMESLKEESFFSDDVKSEMINLLENDSNFRTQVNALDINNFKSERAEEYLVSVIRQVAAMAYTRVPKKSEEQIREEARKEAEKSLGFKRKLGANNTGGGPKSTEGSVDRVEALANSLFNAK